MIINYEFENYRSFKDLTRLSMKATSQTTFNENLIRKNGLRILPSVVIYGANASGKSNVINSLDMFRKIVSIGSISFAQSDLVFLELCPFTHDKSKNEPMVFSIDFINKGIRFSYTLKISVGKLKKTDRKINEESLNVIKNSGESTNIFSRINNEVVIPISKEVTRILELDEDTLNKLSERINSNIDSQELFLARGFKNTINTKIADVVIDFFVNKLFITRDFTQNTTNISMSTENLPINSNSFVVKNKLIEDFVRKADFGPQKIMFRSEETGKENQVNLRMYSEYKSGNDIVNIPSELMESRGTVKLVDFVIPFQHFFNIGATLIIDEFDAALHPEIVKGLIAMFNNQSVNTSGSQLIFTTHNPIYLNNKIFRRDQILFAEKDRHSYRSTLYSLADFGSTEVRNDENYLINYFKGKYSSLPYLDFSEIVMSKQGDEQ